ncbi:MAG: RNA polymerase sigma factor [Bacteroidales bacterium]|nr:RNA polymerase sigma factor [Bacteroidales bacterium]
MESTVINIHQDLIDACRRGDRTAQYKIYKLYYKAMYNTCLRIVNDTGEAEDIMQESFLEAFRQLPNYTAEGTFGSWLKRIVVNRSLDFLRKTKFTLSIEEEQLDFPETDEPNREEEMILRVNEVKSAMLQLPDNYRIILSLFLFEGYDHEEISQILNISNQLSRTRYSRARQKLLEILKEKGKYTSYNYN